VLRGVDAALDKTRTPLAADMPARAFRLPPRGQPGCVQQLDGIGSMVRIYEKDVKRFYSYFRHKNMRGI
jgi:hypothetical protein